MANETKTEEKKTEETPEMVTVMFNGVEIEIEKTSRLYSQVNNLIVDQQEQVFSDRRQLYLDAIAKGINAAMNGYEDVLEGMSIVFDLSTEGPLLVPTERVTVKKRGANKKE